MLDYSAILGTNTKESRTMSNFGENFYSWMHGEGRDNMPVMDEGYHHPDGSICKAKTPEDCPFYKLEFEEAEAIEEQPLKSHSRTENKKISKNFRQHRDAMAKKLEKNGTYDFATGEPKQYDSGYQVSFQEETTERKGHSAYIPDAEYDRRVLALSAELGVSPDLGTFGEPEISFHVESLDKALEVARRHNQESIYDWSTHGTTYDCIPNKDFVGRTHYADRDNHTGNNYHSHKDLNNID